ncbi:MAG: nicotinamide-nucleotide amidohydrolase family protein [Clostridia bacterium]|nr:nicotinamide-nucleotide amidohydrolase family protein [Clostridia bacterium]
MKTALILFRSAESQNEGEYLDKIISIFANNGFLINSVDMLSVDDDLGFKRRLESLKETADNLAIIYNPNTTFSIKQKIADDVETFLDENENAFKFYDAICKRDGIEYPIEYCHIPMGATLIPNVLGAYQGFMIDDMQFTMTLLPSEINEISVMVDKYLVPYLEEKYGVKRKRVTLKYVGEINKVNQVVEKAREVSESKFSCEIEEKYGDIKINLLFENFETDGGAIALRYIVGSLKEDIYAEYDVSLEQRLFDVLALKNLKLSVAESFTSGKIASSIIENSGASKIFHEGIVCYSNKSKVKRLNVKVDDLVREGAVSSIVAYQMALGLLQQPECDVAIATTGIAGPKSDDTEKPVGLCYIAVGMRDGIHTYKFNLTGNRKAITLKAKNKALFLTIKKLKNL